MAIKLPKTLLAMIATSPHSEDYIAVGEKLGELSVADEINPVNIGVYHLVEVKKAVNETKFVK